MKKTGLIKTTAVFLAASIMLATASYALVLGENIDGYTAQAPGRIALANGVYWTGSCYQNENYLQYTPSSDVSPVVVYGSKVTNYGNFDTMASLLENEGYNVIAGINGDYFNTSNYEPLGLVVSEGILRTGDGGHWAVGFKPDGSAVIGKPGMKVTVTIGWNNYSLSTFNKCRSNLEFAVFTDDFAYNTKTTKPGKNAILSVVSGGEFKMNGEVQLVVDEIIESDSQVSIPEGKVVLSLAETADAWRQEGMAALAPGAAVTIKTESSPEWNDVSYAVGSLYKLVTAGAVEPNLQAASEPRTAVGVKADGTIIFYTVDGRQAGYSNGISMTLLASRLIELGCVEAAIMDGGGSTSLNAMYIGDSSLSQINSPSEGYQRSVTNYIMLVTKTEPTNIASKLAVYPLSTHMLSGATADFTVKAADNFGYAAAVPGGVSLRADANIGVIDANGIFKAGGEGTGSVTASAAGLTSGSVPVQVVSTPDEITVKDEANNKTVTSLEILKGESVNLTASAVKNHLDLICDDSCFTWSLTGDIGTIDSTGVFTAASEAAVGTINVTAGSRTVMIQVEVISPLGIFDDVPEDDPYYEAIKFVGEARLFNGMSETEFVPDGEMTRAMFATVLWRLEGMPEISQTNNFSDVKNDTWYTKAVLWANSEQIVLGYGDGTYGINDPVTREQMLTIIYRYAACKGVDVTAYNAAAVDMYPDYGTAAEYAREAVKWAVGTGVFTSPAGQAMLDCPGIACRGIVAQTFMNLMLFTE